MTDRKMRKGAGRGILSLCLSLVTLLSLPLSLAGCGAKDHTVRIGVVRGDASSEEALAFENYLRLTSDQLGVQIDFSRALESADEELAAVQNYASLGYDGILALTSYNPTSILKKCQKYRMYLVFAAMHPDFEDSDRSLDAVSAARITDYTPYPYYVGAAGPSDYGEMLSGLAMGRAAVARGYRKYSVFTGSAAYGQPMHALRIAGFLIAMHEVDPTVTYAGIACDEENWKAIAGKIKSDLGVRLSSFSSEQFSILAQTGGYSFFQGDTAAVASVAQLSAAPGVEAVFCAGSADGISAFAPKGASCVYVGNDSLGDTFKDLFREGKLIFDIAKYNSYLAPAYAFLLKSILMGQGVRIDGRPVSLEQESLQIRSSADYDLIGAVENADGGYFFSREVLSAFLSENELPENDAGIEKLDAVTFAALCTTPCTLGADGLYEKCAEVRDLFTASGEKFFDFASREDDKRW